LSLNLILQNLKDTFVIDKQDLINIVQSAFNPLECVAELQNYEHAFGFRVYLPHEEDITREEKNINLLLLNEHELISLISSTRSEIEGKGIVLEKWSFSQDL
jgi:hypothetical protein